MDSSRSAPSPHPAPSSTPSRQHALRAALDGAKRVLKRRFRVLLLVRDAYELEVAQPNAFRRVRDDLTTLLRLLKAWALRRYQRMPWPSLLLVASAVVYFVTPADLIPDLLPGIGFMDDVAVVSAVVQAVRDELERFRAWERDDPEALSIDSALMVPKRAT